MRRAWLNTKANLGGGDKTILESVEAGENTAKNAYNKALSGVLPSSLTEIVGRQPASVQLRRTPGFRDRSFPSRTRSTTACHSSRRIRSFC